MNTTTHTPPETLHTALVNQLHDQGHVYTAPVEKAFRAVQRHLFLPETPVKEAYADQFVVTKRDADGVALSSASQPSVVAMMLEQLDVRPGHRVLEIGAGTGYNAALLRELVGPAGQVTTIDIDPDVVDQARQRLGTGGYDDVHLIAGDGALGDETHAPYDRIIITAGAWDLPPAWWDQLADNGRLVVPLRWRGTCRSIAFDREQGRMASRSVKLCGFIPMQGVAGEGERSGIVTDEADVTLHYDQDQQIDRGALRGVLDQPRSEAWSEVTVGGQDPFDGVWLRLSITEPGTCRIAVQPTAIESGRATPAIPSRSPALANGTSLAYFATRPHTRPGDTNGSRRHELGAIGHGPEGADLAYRIASHIRAWNRDRNAQPVITAYPAGTPDDRLPRGFVIDKPYARLVFTHEITP